MPSAGWRLSCFYAVLGKVAVIQIAPALELAILFIAMPLAYRFSPWRIPPLPLLWVVTAYAWLQLLRDVHFARAKLWNLSPLPAHLGSILTIFAVVAAILSLGVWLFAPNLLFGFPRQHPILYVVVMLAYPVLSVYPQALIYRVFFFQRYASLFPGNWTMILASATAFAFLHIVFRNSLAVAFTFAGGLLFAFRYAQTGSLATTAFEHALYGCWLFTLGLGQYFYHGTIASIGAAIRR